jgi:hypothetical protein
MFNRGDMVRTDGTPPMQFIRWRDGVAECLLIDDDGILRLRFVYPQYLQPMRQSLQPRTCWSETRQIDVMEIEAEERRAAEIRRLERRASKKSKRSNKLKRRTQGVPS